MLNAHTYTYSAKDGLHSRSQNKHSLQDSMWTDLKSYQASGKKGMQSLHKGGEDQLADTSFQWDSTVDTSSDM